MIGCVSVEDWGRDLRELIARGQTNHGAAEVLAVLQREVASMTLGMEAPPTTLTSAHPVLGVDACVAGWVGVLLGPDGRLTVHVAGSIQALVSQVREGADVAVVAIDIPIGLPDTGARQADRLARDALPGKASSVFSTLTRSAYAADSYADSREANLAATDGERSASAQAWALGPKILQVDAWVRGDPGTVVVEVHPELCFARMTGAPILAAKRSEEGVALRRAALGHAGIVAPPWYSGSGFAEDDLLDACAALWTGVRHLHGESESLPAEPEVFSDGLPAAIRV
jgi:predicted RNase H-like nuclease